MHQCRVSVTRAKGRRTPPSSLSMCHAQLSDARSYTNVLWNRLVGELVNTKGIESAAA